MSIQRQFERHQRIVNGVDHPKVLDKFNDTLEGNDILHATKGHRTYSIKRGKAALITAKQKKGEFPPSIHSRQTIKEMLLSQESV